jgi:hypothetical protein
MKMLLAYLWKSRTTAFGYILTVLGVIAASDGLFSARGLKWILLVNGILTACLGHYNNLKIRQAAADVAPPAP